MQLNCKIVEFDEKHEKAPAPNTEILADKVLKFKWRPIGEAGEFKWISKKLLKVDRSYQREDEYKDKIIAIAADWKWESCGAISVMEREGIYMVVDGQNRTLAAWKRSDIVELPCIVFKSQGIEHEASSFIEINTHRKAVSAYTKFRARLVAGNLAAADVAATLEENNLTLKPDGKTQGSLTCIAACERIYSQNPNRFKASIALASVLAMADETIVCQILLLGLSVIDRKIPGGFADVRLVRRIQEVGAKALVDAAKKMSYRAGKGGEVVWAEGMLEIINRKRGIKFTFS